MKAQIFPVNVNVLLPIPYSLNTSDYYNGTAPRLIVTLTNTDLQKPVLSVRLRMYIEGQNAKMQSRDGVYYPTITLDAGIPQRLSLGDLAPYFNIDNLNFSGITRAMYAQNGKLPEGFYSFCFEVVEVNTGQVLSRKSCSMAYITLSDPPLLNLPVKGESIASRAVQNVIFQWTPRNLGSPNGAFNTEYEFTLKELWDIGIAPEAAFESTQPLYQVTVRPTTLLMGPAEPQLIPGKRYAWRVRAISTSPTGEQADSYRNNGFSEIYWFTYQSDCKPPLAINSSVSSGRANINWTADPSSGGMPAGGYTLQYRERSLSGSKWYSVNTLENRAILYDLKPGTTYEYRVGSSCVAGNIGIGTDQATYSDLLTLEINGNPNDTATVNCGMISPEIAITNRTSIQALNQGDLIMAGGFPVKLTKVTGGGSFSGEGYVTIPMLGQVNVKVRFSNIQVNTERQLFGGVIETTYDPKEEQLADAKEIYDDIKDLVTGIIDKLKDLLKSPIKNKEEIAKAEKELGDEYTKMVNELPISEEEKKTKLDAYKELKGMTILASNSETLDEATIQAAAASKKLDEFKENLKADLEKAKVNLVQLEQIDNYYLLEKPAMFLSPANKIISLPAGTKVYFYCVDHTRTNNGVLHGFILPDGRQYYMRQNGWVGTTFAGYRNKNNEVYLPQNKENLGKQKITYLHHYQIEGQGNYEYWLIEHEVDVKQDQISAEKDFSGYIHEIEYKADKPDKTFIVTLSVSCGNFTDLSVAGKYKLKITKNDKTGKFEVEFELEGKQSDKIKDGAEKAKIEKEVKKLAEEKINQLAGGKTDKDGYEAKSQKVEEKDNDTTGDDGGFYVKDMNWSEWATTIGDMGSSVWENAALPEGYWNKDKDYTKSPIHIPPTIAGVSDGAIGLVADYPQLVKLGYDLATKKEVRTGIWEAVKNISPSSVVAMAESGVKDKIAKYNFTDKGYSGYHEIGKDGVAVVSTIMGAGFIAKANDGLENGVKETGEKIRDAIKKKLKDIEEEFLGDAFKELLKAKFKNYKGLLSLEEWTLRYKTLYKNRKIGKLTEDEFELLEGGLKPRKAITTSDGKRYFDNVLEGTAREVKSGPISLSGSKQQILKDIEILNEELAKGVDKIEWHCFDNVEKEAIEKFVNENLKTNLQNKGLFKIINH